MSGAPAVRERLRARLADGARVIGTFVKAPSLDVVDLVSAAGADFAVVDLEHSQLSAERAGELVRHATAIGLPALVRVPSVDAALINRLLEVGAAGIQLSMLRRRAQRDGLRSAARYAPDGARSLSMLHPSAGYGAPGLAAYLAAERDCPPILVGQIETVTTEDPLPDLLDGLDVAFVGTSDLSVDIGLGTDGAAMRLRDRVGQIEEAATRLGTRLGGWVPDRRDLGGYGLGAARYLVVGSDLQFLRAGLRSAGFED